MNVEKRANRNRFSTQRGVRPSSSASCEREEQAKDGAADGSGEIELAAEGAPEGLDADRQQERLARVRFLTLPFWRKDSKTAGASCDWGRTYTWVYYITNNTRINDTIA